MIRARVRGILLVPSVPQYLPLDRQRGAKRITLALGYCPGDAVIMSSLIKPLADLGYRVGINSPFPEVWRHNPHVVTHADGTSALVRIRLTGCQYGETFAGFMAEQVSRRIGEPLVPAARPALYLTDEERAAVPSYPRPWVVVNAGGGKGDCPVKHIPFAMAQESVSWLVSQGVTVLQVGAAGDSHKPLAGAVNLIGKTTLRQLMALAYGADFCLSGITALCHIAAAFSTPAICCSAGRESPEFIRWPSSIMLSSIGQLDCCKTGGCWRWDFGTGDRSCVLPVIQPSGPAPECMLRIGSAGIIEAAKRILSSLSK